MTSSRVALALGLFASAAGFATPLPPQDLHHIENATVFVQTREAEGSGFVVGTLAGQCLIVTNNHVIAGPSPVSVQFYAGSGGSPAIPARVLVADPRQDLALLLAAPDNPPPGLRLSDAEPAPGSIAISIGFPLGSLLSFSSDVPTATVNFGRLARDRIPEAVAKGWYQLSLGLNHGNSGGPTVGPDLSVIGVSSAILEGKATAFLIPAAQVRAYIDTNATGWTPAADWPHQTLTEEPEVALDQALKAMVFTEPRAGAARIAGFAFGRKGPDRLVALGAAYRPGEAVVLYNAAGARLSGRVLRSDWGTASVLAVRATDAELPVVAFSDAWFSESEPVRAIVPVRGPGPLRTRRLSGRVSGIRYLESHERGPFTIDVGILDEFSGVTVNSAGQATGLLVGGAAGTNVALALPERMIRHIADGEISMAALRIVWDGDYRCAIEAMIEVDDPLGSISSVGLNLDYRHIFRPETVLTKIPIGESVTRVPLGPKGRSELTAVYTRCTPDVLTVQPYAVRWGYLAPLDSELVRPPLEPMKERQLFFHSQQASERRVLQQFLERPMKFGPGFLRGCQWSDFRGCLAECARGNQRGCVQAGRIYELQQGNPDEALALYKTACNKGELDGCALWSRLLDVQTPDLRGAAKVRELRKQACEPVHREGCDTGERLTLHPEPADQAP